MKIKGSAGVSLKNISLISAAVFLLLTVLRIYQSFAITEAGTGFFSSNNFTVPVMYALAIIGVAAVLPVCFVSGDLDSRDINRKASVPAGIASFIMAIALVFDGFSRLDSIQSLPPENAEGVKSIFGSGAGTAGVVFAFAGALVLVVHGFFILTGKSLPSFMKIPMLFPVLWAFTNTLSFFSITVSYVKVVQLLLSIFTAVFLMLFIFENARISSDVGKKDALWFFYATGIITAGLGAASCIPAILIYLIAPEKECIYAPFSFTAIAGVLYTLTQLFYRSGSKITEESFSSEGEEAKEDAVGGETNNIVTEKE